MTVVPHHRGAGTGRYDQVPLPAALEVPMPAPRPRTTFGDEVVDRLLTEALGATGTDIDDDLVRSIMVTALDMDRAEVDRLELKIANQSLAEMLNAWRVFSPWGDNAKVTVFGSARTKPGHPDYELAKDFGARLAERGWMAITGAGPGIMTAGIEGTGRENAFGVNIVLPFEQTAADIIEGDEKLATFRYFFTRKLTFMKESDAFALFPGGFGTLDEAFELMTLVQTGKSYPVPIVLLDHPGSSYWSSWQRFVDDELLAGGMISGNDTGLYLHTHDPDEAVEYICSFYSCYHSIRFVGKRLVVRLRHPLRPEAIETLNGEFEDIVAKGTIEAIDATPSEQRDDDNVELPRLAFQFDNRSFARLVALIKRINDLGGSTGVKAAAGLVHDVHPQFDDGD
ncbi:MAG: LOG family protein [Actinomycetota bacterium]